MFLSQCEALLSKENENKIILIVSSGTPFYFKVLQSLSKRFRWSRGSSLAHPLNVEFCTILIMLDFISKLLFRIGEGRIPSLTFLVLGSSKTPIGLSLGCCWNGILCGKPTPWTCYWRGWRSPNPPWSCAWGSIPNLLKCSSLSLACHSRASLSFAARLFALSSHPNSETQSRISSCWLLWFIHLERQKG